MRKWEPDEKLIYKQAGVNQACFMRDRIALELLHCVPIFKVSDHMSKSVPLPVYGLTMKNGVKIIARDNFYDWKVSVILPRPLPKDYLPKEIFTNRGDIDSVYLEGFYNDWSFKNYNPQNARQKKFTVELRDKYTMFLLCFYLKNAFPEKEFNPEDDKRSVEEIQKSIEKIYDENGNNDIRPDDSWGKPVDRPVMSAWEILWKTYNTMDDYEIFGGCNERYDYFEKKYWDAEKHPEQERFSLMDVPKYPDVFAAIIKGEPVIHKQFLMEEWLYNQKFPPVDDED